MLLHSYTLLGICCFLCVPFVSSIITCENGAGTSPLLADCYAALSQISDTDDLVGVLRNSAYALDAGSFGKPGKMLDLASRNVQDLLDHRLGLYTGWNESYRPKCCDKVDPTPFRDLACDINMCHDRSKCHHRCSHNRWT
ncbi:MAG: hypothetical protein Q9228_004228 [Teloschistes exilis]